MKQDNPQAVLAGTLTFAPGGGTSTMAPLFDADALLGLASLSDVQTLSPVDALAGTPAADNLLILSLDSRRLVEVNRNGQVLGSFDLAGLTAMGDQQADRIRPHVDDRDPHTHSVQARSVGSGVRLANTR